VHVPSVGALERVGDFIIRAARTDANHAESFDVVPKEDRAFALLVVPFVDTRLPGSSTYGRGGMRTGSPGAFVKIARIGRSERRVAEREGKQHHSHGHFP
jgi:hypothetical protein